MSKSEKSQKDYCLFKKGMYLILTGLTLLFSTCAGRDAVSAIVSGKNEDVGYVIPAIVFGIVSFLCYLGFRKYSNKVDTIMGVADPEDEDEDVEKE
jgi:hypothetical protein